MLAAIYFDELRFVIHAHAVTGHVVEQIHGVKIVEIPVFVSPKVAGENGWEAVGQILERELFVIVRIDVGRGAEFSVENHVHSVSACIPLLDQFHRHLGRNIGFCCDDDSSTGQDFRAGDVKIAIASTVFECRTNGFGAVKAHIVVLDFAVVVFGACGLLVIVVVNALEVGQQSDFFVGRNVVDAYADEGSFVNLAKVQAE